MPRQAKPRPSELTINANVAPTFKGAATPDPKSSPMNLEGIDLSSFGGDIGMDIASLPPLPQSPPIPPSPGLHKRETSRTATNGVKSRMNSEPETRDQRSHLRQAKDDEDFRPSSSSMSKIYHLRKNPGSTPELSLVGSKENVRKQSNEGSTAQPDVRPQPSPQHSEDSVSVRRKDKGFRNPLARSKSIRRDSHSKARPNGVPTFDQPLKTAPLAINGQNSADMGWFNKGKANDRRGKSAERAATSESDENPAPVRQTAKDKEKEKDKKGGSGFVSGSKNVMSKAATGTGGLFSRLGKVGRSGSSTAKEIPDGEYVLKIIHLPLIEQTQLTRISKDLAQCRDKTEYWMPSLPWRCIDYLNMNCDSEGLYRVPGSGPQVKHWQRRFDTELDVNLLDESELYDPNNIGSMLKSWLRELPSEIMPKTLQHALAEEISKKNPDYQKAGQQAPQELRDCLSNMPPFNYYLLFAITCHLSLLLSHQDKNKMDLNNLSICIGPCLDLERWLFNYLVADWRHCWQGCFTEKPYLLAEKAYAETGEYVEPTLPIQTNEQEDFYDPEEEDESLEVGHSERRLHSSGKTSSRSRSRGGSTQGSRYEDARSTPHSPQRTFAESTSRNDLSATPRATTTSKYAANGSASAPNGRQIANMAEQRRPATAGKGAEVGGVESESAAPKTATPRQPHSRSQSEYQLSPVKPSSPVDFPFLRDS